MLDLAAHLNEEPPAYRILAWKYLKPKARKLSEEQIQQQHMELSGELGQRAQKMPEYMKDMLRWVEEHRARMEAAK